MLNEVKHVTYLGNNLISTRQFGSEGCVSTFIDKTWMVTKGALVVEKSEKGGTLYLCNGHFDYSISLASIGMDKTLWHHRLGNMSDRGYRFSSPENWYQV